MGGKKLILFLFFLFGMVMTSYGQTVPYTYIDPCTGQPTTVQVPSTSGTVTMFYGGQYQTFTYAQLQAGAYDQWVNSINAQFPPGTDPCAGLGGEVTNDFNTQLGSQSAGNVANITSIVQMAAGLANSTSGAANTAGGISSSLGGGSSSGDGGTSNDNNDNGGDGSSSNSGTNTGGSTGSSSSSGGNTSTGGNSGSGTSTGGSTGNGGGSTGGSGSSGNGGGNTGGSGSSGGSSTGGGGNSGSGNNNPNSDISGTGGNTGTNDGDATESSEMGAMGSQTNTTASGGQSESSGDSGGGGSSKSKSKQEKVGRGALIGAGDVVVIRNSSNIKETGMDNFKFNMSLTHLNTKQTFIKGANFNYQTGENLGNLTLYGSLKTEKNMFIFSNSSMTNFTSDWFNTTSIMDAFKINKVTVMGGTNFTYGYLGKGEFSNWSLIAGGFTNFGGGRRMISSNVMLLSVYSPYIFYYEGQWYKSGLLFVPLINNDIRVTDTFKWSISFAGVYQYEGSVLNWQLSTGTKILL